MTTTDISFAVASFSAYLSIAVGMFQFIAPKTVIKRSKAPTGPINTYLIQIAAVITASVGCLQFFQIVYPVPFSQAIGISMIPWIISCVRDIIARPDIQFGLSQSTFLRRSIASMIVAYCGFTNSTYIMVIAKCVGSLCVMVGSTLVYNPELYHNSSNYEKKIKQEPIVPSTMRYVGFCLIMYAIYIFCSLQGNPIRGVGYAWIPIIANLCCVLWGPIPKGIYVAREPQLGWLIVSIFISGSTTLL